MSYTLVLSGDFQNCLQELHIMNHRFFWSCMFLSRKMNQCCSNRVSSCTEVWQMCRNYLESCTVHCVHLVCTWERSLESLVFFECPLLVFCEVTLWSLFKVLTISRTLVSSVHRGLLLAIKRSQIWDSVSLTCSQYGYAITEHGNTIISMCFGFFFPVLL